MKTSWSRYHGGGIMEEEASGEHLGALWEASGMVLGAIWESFGSHFGTQATQEAPGGPGLKK